jgi:hypothetical protein
MAMGANIQLSFSCVLQLETQLLSGLLTPPSNSVAERFVNTIIKLGVFQIYDLGYTKFIFLDADMAVFRNPDQLSEIQLPAIDHVATNQPCV